MPFDLDCNDSDFRAHLSEEQLARLERRQSPARRAAQPPTALAAAVDRLSSGAEGDTTSPAQGNTDALLVDVGTSASYDVTTSGDLRKLRGANAGQERRTEQQARGKPEFNGPLG